MTEERKRRITWGALLLVGALGCASLRNNPALGIRPLAVGVINALIYVCMLAAVRISGWKAAAVIGLATPVYLWLQRFLDGYMVPVEMLAHLTMIFCMCAALRHRTPWWVGALVLAVPAFVTLLAGSTAAMWLVKREGPVRAMVVAWNAAIYPGISILAASLVCAPWKRREKAAQQR